MALNDRGLLIRGASGSGKSTLALDLIALGATLVSDDRVMVSLRDGAPWMTAPQSLSGLIEARGIGILRAPACSGAAIAAVVDMDATETDRLPPFRKTALLGVDLPLLHNTARASFAVGVMHYLRYGRKA
ncbi:HPr kinase/phosphatase C-terminal domain-containing protein [Mesobacterium sp. TK19101]|uniref:HPr kinase/phosphatase C-terminal domain-containing protein n=1 Tax=Mesobacterium hydrothermale TaxID=3111907 RepID=A0ABU6HHC9_9RHOB|nr:HPr kinase/phosphatase C-terminal domain-containing protein [Mesobacterium sp. TK19101]MEC3861507.1 HPr kinase/phosphatase C-terminal domain-containing protein [Mesobacterium sp. TK19101]